MQEGFRKADGPDIGEAGRHDADDDTGEERDPFAEHLRADELADPGAEEGTEDFRDAAAEQERERAAGEGRRKAQFPGVVVGGLFLKFVEHVVVLTDGRRLTGLFKLRDQLFDGVELVGVDACRPQGKGLGIGLALVEAGEFERQKTDVRGTGHAEGAGHDIERPADTPGTGSDRQGQEADAGRQGRFFF